MRTTVMLSPELMRAAKARSAERGESLKSLLARAIAAELAVSSARAQPSSRVRLPLFGDPAAAKVTLTNRDLAAALSNEDAAGASGRGRTPTRRARG